MSHQCHCLRLQGPQVAAQLFFLAVGDQVVADKHFRQRRRQVFQDFLGGLARPQVGAGDHLAQDDTAAFQGFGQGLALLQALLRQRAIGVVDGSHGVHRDGVGMADQAEIHRRLLGYQDGLFSSPLPFVGQAACLSGTGKLPVPRPS